MKEIILVKYGEIILKGCNRSRFEKVLLNNIHDAIKHICEMKITVKQATIYIDVQDQSKMDLVCDRLTRVFGIVSICLHP